MITQLSPKKQIPTPNIDNYVRIELDAGGLDPNQLKETFTGLRSLRCEPTLEFRLVADEHVHYYVGASNNAIIDVTEALRELFPDNTTFKRAMPPKLPRTPTAALTLRGDGVRPDDWQTRLHPITTEETTETRLPLANVVNRLGEIDGTVHYQALLTPKSDWEEVANLRVEQLKQNRDTPIQRLIQFIIEEYNSESPFVEAFSRTSERASFVNRNASERIDAINEATPEHSYAVYARAVAAGQDDYTMLECLQQSLRLASDKFYRINPKIYLDEEIAQTMASDIRNGTVSDELSVLARLKRQMPGTSNARPEIVASPKTAPNLCLIDGASLTPEGQCALQRTPQ